MPGAPGGPGLAKDPEHLQRGLSLPPHATRRLNLVLVPADWDRPPDPAALERLERALVDEGFIQPGGRPGPRATELMPAGFKLFRVDIPPRYGVYGNRVGGFHVRCPHCQADIPKPWGDAVETLRREGRWALACPSCGRDIGAQEAETQPFAAIARFAVEFRDVGGKEFRPIRAFNQALGADFKTVLVRG